MSFTQTAAPAKEPLTTDEVKLHAHMEADETIEDTELDIFIKAAREHVESYTQRPLITQTFTYFADCFDGVVKLKANLLSVQEIRYIDEDGMQQTLASSEYEVDVNSTVGRVYPAFGLCWPSARQQRNAIEIDFTVGFGAAATDIPESIRHAMLLLIGHWYMNREAVMVGTPSVLPFGVELLLNPYKVWSF